MELEDDFGEARGGVSRGEGEGGRLLLQAGPGPSRSGSVSLPEPRGLQWVVDYFKQANVTRGHHTMRASGVDGVWPLGSI